MSAQGNLAAALARKATAEKALADWRAAQGYPSTPTSALAPAQAQQSSIDTSSEKHKPKTSRKTLWIILGVVGAAALGTGGYFVWRHYK